MRLLLTFALAVSAEPVGHRVVLPELASLTHFKSAVASDWQFECGQEHARFLFRREDSRIAEDLKNFVIPAVYEGLKRLERLNPDLTRAIVERSAGRGIDFRCDEPPSSVARHLGWPVVDDTIELGKAARVALLEGARNRERAAGIFKSAPEESWLGVHRNTAFHEFLHSAGLPYNERHGERVDESRESDLVFACAAQAYPFDVLVRRGGRKVGNSARACFACARHLSKDLPRATRACRDIREEDFPAPHAP